MQSHPQDDPERLSDFEAAYLGAVLGIFSLEVRLNELSDGSFTAAYVGLGRAHMAPTAAAAFVSASHDLAMLAAPLLRGNAFHAPDF